MSDLPSETIDPNHQKADARLRQFIERIERLEEEKKDMMADIRGIYAEAKAVGFEPKIMRMLVRLRKMEASDRQEQERLLEIYKGAVGL